MEITPELANALISIEMPYAMALTILKTCRAGKKLGVWERAQIVRDFETAIDEFEAENVIA